MIIGVGSTAFYEVNAHGCTSYSISSLGSEDLQSLINYDVVEIACIPEDICFTHKSTVGIMKKMLFSPNSQDDLYAGFDTLRS